MTDKERFDAIQSALVGLSVNEAREFLYRFMDKRLEEMIIVSPDVSSAADAALVRMAEKLGENP